MACYPAVFAEIYPGVVLQGMVVVVIGCGSDRFGEAYLFGLSLFLLGWTGTGCDAHLVGWVLIFFDLEGRASLGNILTASTSLSLQYTVSRSHF